MADDADRAADSLEIFNERNIGILSAAATSLQREIFPKGKCHFCHEPFSPENKQLFCDADCSADYHQEQKQKKHKLY